MSIDHGQNIIEVQDVSFSYGNVLVLKDVSLTVHQGDYLGIIGPNGSGKSTLLKLMLGLLKPISGEIKLFGHKISEFHDWYKLGYVPQKAVNFDSLFPATVSEIVEMGRYGKRGLGRKLNKHDHDMVEKSLQQVEMLDYRDRLIGDLSSGQQQRVFIARALAGEPEVIFLDEPTVGVDVQTQDNFYSLLKKLNRDLGLTMVLISHDLDVVSSEATEVACVNQNLIYHSDAKDCMKNEVVQKLYGQNTSVISHNHP
ncbi:MAG: hypothetical protein ACD_72C00346G0004 [uncultured bacterium]|nr:MAG: hypothetical protein ACD_72C00346G0004 [uncultured bacterium]